MEHTILENVIAASLFWGSAIVIAFTIAKGGRK